jgi:outer membrane protein assembly factor BamB
MPVCIRPALIIVILGALCGAHAADWPQQRGPLWSGAVAAGEAPLNTLPSEPRVVWKGPVAGGFAAPVMAGGRVYYLDLQQDKEVVHALNAATAKPLWEAPLFSAHKDGFGTGPRCAPVVDGKLVFAQSCKGEFQCLAADTGKVVWRTNFVDDFGGIYIGEKGDAKGGSRHGFTGGPLVDGDVVYVQVGSPKGAGVVCFQKATGKVVWKSQNDMAGYAPPLLATLAGVRQLVSFTAEGLIGLGVKDGALLWRVPITTPFGRHVTAPVVHGDLVVVASHAVGLIATRIVRKGDVFAAEPAWTHKEFAMNFSSPVVVGDHLYGLGPAKNVECIALATGEAAWQQPGCVSSSADKAFASFITMGDRVLMLNDSGELILFAADPRQFTQLGRVQVCGSNWCHPAYADGRLYLRDHKQLMCVELAEKK